MFDRILQYLVTANDFEFNAKRLFETESKPPDWANTYLECLGDARRQRAAARNLVVASLKDSGADEVEGQAGEAAKCSDETRRMTMEQLLQLAATARSSSVGSRKLRRAAEQMSLVAALLHSNKAMAQLLWWSADVEPVPPGKPVIDAPEAWL